MSVGTVTIRASFSAFGNTTAGPVSLVTGTSAGSVPYTACCPDAVSNGPTRAHHAASDRSGLAKACMNLVAAFAAAVVRATCCPSMLIWLRGSDLVTDGRGVTNVVLTVVGRVVVAGGGEPAMLPPRGDEAVSVVGGAGLGGAAGGGVAAAAAVVGLRRWRVTGSPRRDHLAGAGLALAGLLIFAVGLAVGRRTA